MIYWIDKNLWVESSENVVRNEVGAVVIRLERSSKLFSSKITVYDRYHVEIGVIKKKGLTPYRYDIIFEGQVAGTIHRKIGLFSRKLIVRSVHGPKFHIKGSLKSYDITISRQLRKIVRTHPQNSQNTSKYGFECIDEEYEYLLLCSVIALLNY